GGYRADRKRGHGHLRHQHDPDRPVLRPRHPSEEVDHAFPRADRVARTAHPDPVLQEDSRDDRPDDRRSENGAGTRGKDDLTGADVLGAPDERRAYQKQNPETP